MSLANAFERRAAMLLAEVARLTGEVAGDPPELGSTRRAAIVEKVGDLGTRFSRLADDVRRQELAVDARVAGLSRYVRGEAAYRERQRQRSRQEAFHDVQLAIRQVGAALKLLSDALAGPPGGVTAKGVHDLIEEFAKTVANYAAGPQHRTSTTATISMPDTPGIGADQVQGAADLLLLFGILLRALYVRLKAAPNRAEAVRTPAAAAALARPARLR